MKNNMYLLSLVCLIATVIILSINGTRINLSAFVMAFVTFTSFAITLFLARAIDRTERGEHN